jgi:hypothetical protein
MAYAWLPESKQEMSMQSSFVATPKAVSFHISRNLVAVVLFALLGLTVSLAVISHIPAEELAAILVYGS